GGRARPARPRPPRCAGSAIGILPSSASASSLSFFLLLRPPPSSTLFPYTTLFRSYLLGGPGVARDYRPTRDTWGPLAVPGRAIRSEEHTSELQSRSDLVCRLLLEKKKINHANHTAGDGENAARPRPSPTCCSTVGS